MDPHRFDSLARTLALAASRRGALGAAVGILAGLLGQVEAEAACVAVGKKCSRRTAKCCHGGRCRGGTCRCVGNKKRCGKQCIPKRQCCSTADCQKKMRGSVCRNGACTCPGAQQNCGGVCRGSCECEPGTKPCDGACIPEDACCTSADCPDETKCCDGDCHDCCSVADCPEPVGAICDTNNMCRCPNGQSDCNGTCQQCCQDFDCGFSPGVQCVEGTCACPNGVYCRSDVGGYCSAECCGNEDCPSGQRCCNGTCQECCSNDDCSGSTPCCVTGDVCFADCNGVCCPHGATCTGGTCQADADICTVANSPDVYGGPGWDPTACGPSSTCWCIRGLADRPACVNQGLTCNECNSDDDCAVIRDRPGSICIRNDNCVGNPNGPNSCVIPCQG